LQKFYKKVIIKMTSVFKSTSPIDPLQLSTDNVVTSSGAVVAQVQVRLFRTGDVKTIYLQMPNTGGATPTTILLPVGTVPPTFLPFAGVNILPIVVRNNTSALGVLSIASDGSVLIGTDVNFTGFTSAASVGLGISAAGVSVSYY
jgi:hypothetical protein